MGSRMMANELMVAADRAIQPAAVERGWRADQARRTRASGPSTAVLLRAYAGGFLLSGGALLRRASDRLAAAGLYVAGRMETSSN